KCAFQRTCGFCPWLLPPVLLFSLPPVFLCAQITNETTADQPRNLQPAHSARANGHPRRHLVARRAWTALGDSRRERFRQNFPAQRADRLSHADGRRNLRPRRKLWPI